ncbi:MAG: NUDIX domain-containing protein [Prolixibacteraceae bacterium]|nr:NUDIX domain-containing protein [Prolixibacteraceae bacterium]
MYIENEANPANHYKYCPRCGNSGEFNSEQYCFYCSECGFSFFLNAAAAVAGIIFNKKGELLLTERGVDPHKGKYDLPGGFVDPGENAEAAIKRELKEELDVTVENLVFLGTNHNQYPFSGTVVFTLDIFFECQVADFSYLKCSDDVIGYQFIHPINIDFEQIGLTSVREFLKQYLHEQGY